MSATDDGQIIHIAAQPVLVGTHHRQRCAWCGAIIEDQDLTMAARLLEDADKPWPAWPTGELISTTAGEPGGGGVTFVVAHEDGAVLPDGCCAKLDPAVTA